jgi:hypothetical protein
MALDRGFNHVTYLRALSFSAHRVQNRNVRPFCGSSKANPVGHVVLARNWVGLDLEVANFEEALREHAAADLANYPFSLETWTKQVVTART